MNPERDYLGVLDIVRENYLVNGHAGVVAGRPHALAPGSQPHRDDRRVPVLDDQEEWAHVDH